MQTSFGVLYASGSVGNRSEGVLVALLRRCYLLCGLTSGICNSALSFGDSPLRVRELLGGRPYRFLLLLVLFEVLEDVALLAAMRAKGAAASEYAGGQHPHARGDEGQNAHEAPIAAPTRAAAAARAPNPTVAATTATATAANMAAMAVTGFAMAATPDGDVDRPGAHRPEHGDHGDSRRPHRREGGSYPAHCAPESTRNRSRGGHGAAHGCYLGSCSGGIHVHADVYVLAIQSRADGLECPELARGRCGVGIYPDLGAFGLQGVRRSGRRAS